MAMLKLDNQPFRIDPIPNTTMVTLSKYIRQDMRLTFVPLAMSHCDRNPQLKNLPSRVTQRPLVFFNGTSLDGKTDERLRARNRAGVLRYLRLRNEKQLRELVASEVGEASIDVPAKELNALLPSRYRLVFGIYTYRRYIKFSVAIGHLKRHHFIVGIPIAHEWCYFEVGACGRLVEDKTEMTETGPITVPLTKPKFVAGPYRKHKKAVHHYVPPFGSASGGPFSGPLHPPYGEIDPPSYEWLYLRILQGRFKDNIVPGRLMLTPEELNDVADLRKARDLEKDGAAVLAKYG